MKSILKIFSVYIALFQCLSLKSQSGLNCANAISVNSFSVCNYSNYSTTGNQIWFKFVAQSKDVNVSVNTSKYGIDIAHIHNISLYAGSCSGLNFITDDELPFEFNAKELNIDMNASGLIVGNTYYLKLNRKALHDNCDKSNCRAGSSTSIAYFSMCIENIDVLVPPDFGIEKPGTNHFYEQNRGQLTDINGNPVPQIKMFSESSSPAVYIADNFTSFVFSKIDTIASTLDSIHKVDMVLVGANTNTRVFKTEQLPNKTNYFLPHCPKGITNNKSFNRSVINEIYPKIDLQHYSNSNGIKFYFVVRPGGNANLIKLKFDGATSTATTSTGGLNIKTALGDITFEKPHVYRLNAANNVVPMPTSGNFIKTGTNEYQIDVQNYPPNMPVIIQIDRGHDIVASPAGITANLNYSTYYGGNLLDQLLDIKVASNGDRVVSGYSAGGTFPTPNGLYTNFISGSIYNAVIIKYTADDTLRFATYFGGNGADLGNSIALNSNGDIFVGGETQSTNMPVTNFIGQTNQVTNGYDPNTGFKSDGFLTKFSSDGLTLLFSRYVGGNKSERINSIHIDANDNLYFAGYTSSPNFPVINAYQSTLGTSANNPDQFNCIVGKFNSGQTAQWITHFGGTNNGVAGTQTQESAMDIVTDNSGNVFIGGQSDEINFPATNPNSSNTNLLFDGSNNGYADGFIARFTPSGVPNYATLVGGNYTDAIKRLVYKPTTGELYFAGDASSSLNFPFKTKTGAYNSTYRLTGGNAFLGYINSNLEHQWISYYGKSKTKYFNVAGLSVDNIGVVYLSGSTNSDSLVYGSTAPVGAYTDNTVSNTDGYMAIFDNNKQIYHAHYFGGTGGDNINNSDIYGNSNLYVVGLTGSSDFPIAYNTITASLIDSTYNGSNDGFISRFNLYPYNLVSVKEISTSNNNLLVFPNPATQTINIKLTKDFDEKVAVTIYNSIGQIVMSETMLASDKAINCSTWSNGMYIINVNSKNINSSFKIIKE